MSLTNETYDVVVTHQQYMFRSFVSLFLKISWLIFEYPIQCLYLRGPSFAFYESKTPDVICAEITNVPSYHWQQNQYECEVLIEKKFHAFIILIYFTIYISILIITIVTLYTRCMRRILL